MIARGLPLRPDTMCCVSAGAGRHKWVWIHRVLEMSQSTLMLQLPQCLPGWVRGLFCSCDSDMSIGLYCLSFCAYALSLSPSLFLSFSLSLFLSFSLSLFLSFSLSLFLSFSLSLFLSFSFNESGCYCREQTQASTRHSQRMLAWQLIRTV